MTARPRPSTMVTSLVRRMTHPPRLKWAWRLRYTRTHGTCHASRARKCPSTLSQAEGQYRGRVETSHHDARRIRHAPSPGSATAVSDDDTARAGGQATRAESKHDADTRAGKPRTRRGGPRRHA